MLLMKKKDSAVEQTFPSEEAENDDVISELELEWKQKINQKLLDILDLSLIETIGEEKARAEIRENASPRHVPAKILEVADIPRTKSGKIVELAVRAVVTGEPVKNVEALANPEALELFRDRPELV